MSKETDALVMEDAISGPTSQQLKEITAFARKMLALERDIAEAEAALEATKKEYAQIATKDLPQAMSSAGVDSLTLKGGYKLEVKSDLSVSLSEKSGKLTSAIAWLKANNLASLIKKQITVEVPKGTDPKIVQQILDAAGKLPYTVAENVNTATFKATLKEQMEKGVAVELSQVGAYAYTQAKLIAPKS